jgi:hypothetical protein
VAVIIENADGNATLKCRVDELNGNSQLVVEFFFFLKKN